MNIGNQFDPFLFEMNFPPNHPALPTNSSSLSQRCYSINLLVSRYLYQYLHIIIHSTIDIIYIIGTSCRPLSVYYMYPRVQMIGKIFQFIPHTRQYGFNLRTSPPQHAGEQRKCVWWHSFKHVKLMVSSKFL